MGRAPAGTASPGRGQARIWVGGLERDVTLEDADDAMLEAVDAA